MIRLVNRRSGGDMWVHESRLEEYLAAGHKLAVPPPPPPQPEQPEQKKAAPRKKRSTATK